MSDDDPMPAFTATVAEEIATACAAARAQERNLCARVAESMGWRSGYRVAAVLRGTPAPGDEHIFQRDHAAYCRASVTSQNVAAAAESPSRGPIHEDPPDQDPSSTGTR